MTRQKVIAVDLDGTLAVYDGWKGHSHIGAPIPEMVFRIKNWIGFDKYKVVIFTARITNDADTGVEPARVEEIRNWLEQAGLPRDLDITNQKRKEFAEMWDDRAVRVEANTGEISNQSEF